MTVTNNSSMSLLHISGVGLLDGTVDNTSVCVHCLFGAKTLGGERPLVSARGGGICC